jgi:hypothetical protein
MLASYANRPYQMAYKMPIEPQHPTIFQQHGCPCLAVIERDFVLKGVE